MFTPTDLFRLSQDTRAGVPHNERGEELGDYYDIRAHVPVIYAIVAGLGMPDPRAIVNTHRVWALEIGVRHGVSTMAILSGMQMCGQPHPTTTLTSLDIDESALSCTVKRIADAGLHHGWLPVVANSNDFISDPRCPRRLDFLMIDGEHRYADVRADFNNYAPLVRAGGYLLMHDYFADCGCTQRGDVSRVVEDARGSGQWDVCVLEWSFGLAVMRRRST